jgi:hypothetical protein
MRHHKFHPPRAGDGVGGGKEKSLASLPGVTEENERRYRRIRKVFLANRAGDFGVSKRRAAMSTVEMNHRGTTGH